MSPVELSILIPVYNEAEIVEASTRELVAGVRELDIPFEILLCENGSRDDTVSILERLAAEFEELRWFSFPEPNYGGALREGIHRARGRFVICEEIDLCDLDFHRRALDLLRAGEAQFVVGSKAMDGADDQRPKGRRVATRVYNGLLRATLGFRGTDTHGLKAFERTAVVDVASRCVVEHDVFASELVIRAQREGIRMKEIPVALEEKRAPSVDLAKRVPRVLRNLGRLVVSIHLHPGGAARVHDD